MPLDTFKVQFPASNILNWNEAAFHIRHTTDMQGAPVSHKWASIPEYVAEKRPGLNDISIDRLANIATMRMSAKVLGMDYAKGITADTITQGLEAVHNSGIVSLNVNGVIDTANILQVDVANNMSLKSGKRYVLDTMAILGESLEEYNCDRYKRGGDSVVFTRMVKGARSAERMTIYDKILDLQKAANKYFMRSLGMEGATEMQRTHSNILRCESNIKSFEAIRRRFNLPDGPPTLKGVLLSKENVNYTLFKKITKKENTLLSLCQEYEGRQWRYVIQDYGYRGLAAANGNDYNACVAFASHFGIKGGALQKARDYFRQAIARNIKADNAIHYVIEEILEALQAA